MSTIGLLLTILTVIGILVFCIVFYIHHSNILRNRNIVYDYTLENLLDTVKSDVVDFVKDNSFKSTSDAKVREEQNFTSKVTTALSKCIYCNDNYKSIVKTFLSSTIIKKYVSDATSGLNQSKLDTVLYKSPTVQKSSLMFETLLYKYITYPAINPKTGEYYEPTYAFRYLCEKYWWDRIRYITEREEDSADYDNVQDDKTQSPPSYIITIDDISFAYFCEISENTKEEKKKEKIIVEEKLLQLQKKLDNADTKEQKAYYLKMIENIKDTQRYILTNQDKLNIITTLIYERYKGIGAIDTIRALDINGINIGTSGSILDGLIPQKHKSCNSAWVFLNSKQIHLDFLQLGSEKEILRIVQLLAKAGNPGPLTEKNPAIVTTMYDKSRVLALRPSLSEYPVVFIRKFSFHPLSLHQVVYPQVKELDSAGHPVLDENGLEITHDAYEDCDLPYSLLKFFTNALINVVVTGRQGSGKTTLMSAMIQHYDPRHTLRIIEMTFELFLREMYPERNIITLQQTPYVTVTQSQDFLKKSDAAITLYGEIATDEMVPNFVQVSQVSSLASLASHHANTTVDLVHSFTNAVARFSNLNDPSVAEDQILSVLRMNVHADYDADGNRYIAYIDEVIPLVKDVNLPKIDTTNVPLSQVQIMRTYFDSQVNNKTFATRRIMHFDKNKQQYIADNLPSQRTVPIKYK